MDQANNLDLNILDDLPPQLYLETRNNLNANIIPLNNISQSKHIYGAYHGLIKPVKFKYPTDIKENWSNIPIYIPKEFRHCINNYLPSCNCNNIDPPLPPSNNDYLSLSIDFLDVTTPYAPCQHKTNGCNLNNLPLVAITPFNRTCQSHLASFKSAHSKKKDSWNFKLLIRCPARPNFHIRIKMSNSQYSLQSDPILVSQKKDLIVIIIRNINQNIISIMMMFYQILCLQLLR